MRTPDDPSASQRFGRLGDAALSPPQQHALELIRAFSLKPVEAGPFNMLLRAPDAVEPLLGFSDYLRKGLGLPERLAELAVLVHARSWGDAYEWQLHAPRALAAGLSGQAVDALRSGVRPHGLRDDEAVAFEFCRQLASTRQVDDAAFAAARAALGEQGVTELTLLMGQYGLVSLLLSVSQVRGEPGTLPSLQGALWADVAASGAQGAHD